MIVTIGFDDGTADQFAASEPLRLHGMHATFFINSGPILAGVAALGRVDRVPAAVQVAGVSAGTSGGSSSRHLSCTYGQRGAKLQPAVG